MTPRILAVDWSGDRSRSHRKIWLAEAVGDQIVRLENGRDREGIVAWLVSEARTAPNVVVGLDFAFSFPAWFVAIHGGTARGLWAEVERTGEGWLERCEPPFWGRPGRKRPGGVVEFRRTDLAVPKSGGIAPKSAFQIGGAGAVGTGSVRGMASLNRLCQAGFSVWPFDEPRLPLVVEIYPRILTGPVNKTSESARRAYVDHHCPQVTEAMRTSAASSEDAFDAAISALVMAKHHDELLHLSAARDPDHQLEGEIWRPRHELAVRAGG